MYFPTMNKKWKGRVLNQSARTVYFMGPEFFWNSFLSLTLGLWLFVILWIGHLKVKFAYNSSSSSWLSSKWIPFINWPLFGCLSSSFSAWWSTSSVTRRRASFVAAILSPAQGEFPCCDVTWHVQWWATLCPVKWLVESCVVRRATWQSSTRLLVMESADVTSWLTVGITGGRSTRLLGAITPRPVLFALAA